MYAHRIVRQEDPIPPLPVLLMASPGPDLFTNATYFIVGIVVTILVVAKVFRRSEVRELPT